MHHQFIQQPQLARSQIISLRRPKCSPITALMYVMGGALLETRRACGAFQKYNS